MSITRRRSTSILPVIVVVFLVPRILSDSVSSPRNLRAQEEFCFEADPDVAIGACTAIVQSGIKSTAILAGAFNDRGIAYAKKQQYERAIADYDQAILLNPNNEKAFDNRGNAYRHNKRYDRAIEDY